MKPLLLLAATIGALMLVPANNGDDACRYIKSRTGLSGYESGGPYTLDHFRLTNGRSDLREFLWKHWHEHRKGVGEAKVGTVDRPIDQPCLTLHADSLVRVPIANPKKDYPSQTVGLWPADEIPPNRVADSA